MALDEEKVRRFAEKMFGDLGGACSVALAVGRFRPATQTPFNMVFEARP